jgi:hypothetical protein
LTCHGPHREADHSPSLYETKCLTCHSQTAAARLPAQAGGRSPTPNSTAGRSTTCPVNPARGCLGCHMPKVPMPDLHTSLTDHYIRIHNRGQPGVGQSQR